MQQANGQHIWPIYETHLSIALLQIQKVYARIRKPSTTDQESPSNDGSLVEALCLTSTKSATNGPLRRVISFQAGKHLVLK